MLRTVFGVLLVLIPFCPVFGQNKADSLKRVVATIDNDSLKILTYQRLRQEFQRSDLNKALYYAEQAEQLARKSGNESSLANALYRKGTVLLNMSRYDDAQEQYMAALKMLEDQKALEGISNVKIDMARLLSKQSKIEQAFKLYLEALPMTRQTGNKNSEARIHNYLGQLYKNQKQLDKAIEHYEKALKLVRELNFKPGISACLANLGGIYTDLGDYERAILMLEESLVLKRETSDLLGASRVLTKLADIANDRFQYDRAFDYLNEALILVKQVNQPTDLCIVKHGLARNAFYRNEFEESIHLSQEIIDQLSETKDLDLAVKTHQLIGEAYGKTGQFEKAYYHAGVHAVLADSLYNAEIISVTNELEERFENDQKAAEIELQAVQLEQSESERSFLIVLVVIALFIALLLYYLYRVKIKANVKLSELNRLKSDFFANISHEFRTPLSLIMAPLRQKIDEAKNEKDKADLNLMYRNADRLLNLIDQLLDLSKLESQSIKLDKSRVEINHFFRLVVASFSSLADHKKINFVSQLPDTEATTEFDQDVLQKVCNNLLSNAFKFTAEGGQVTIKVQVELSRLTFSVADSGEGIRYQDRTRIFDRFYKKGEGNESGSGIGLALTKELVDFHGGEIKMESVEGVGTKFTVTIPITILPQIRESNEVNTITSPIGQDPALTKLPDSEQHLLIIEDNPDLREYLYRTLKSRYNIHLSDNGEDGINIAKELVPDLIISDIMMPKKDGMAVCNELRSAITTNHIPIILLTARADQESKLRGLSYGADDYLLKPFDAEELRVRISNLLEQRDLLRQKYSKLVVAKTDELIAEKPEEEFLKSVVETVGRHLGDPAFTAEVFCDEMAMSRMQLHRKLKALTSLSASEFIRTQRLSKAALLLCTQNRNIADVCYEVGFSSPSYFTKCFKEQFDASPSEYASNSKVSS